MKRLFIFCFILLNNLSFYAFSNTIFYVSTLGNDSWFGKLPTPNSARSDGPFASLEKARDPVKATGKTGPIDVLIREGVYYLEKTFTLDYTDSGTKKAPITYKAYKNETVVISGGFQVTGWETRGNLLKTTIPAVKNQKLYFKQLFVNNQRRQCARNPNKGDFFRINGSVKGNDHSQFKFHPDDIKKY